MKQIALFISLILLLNASGWASDKNTDYDAVVRAFNDFEYEQVVKQSQQLLETEKLDSQQTIELLRMKAIAHYALNQRDMAVLCFVDILKIDPEYRLDPLLNSPKLISFFEKIKANYTPEQNLQEQQPVNPMEAKSTTETKEWRGSLLRSLILPGWGHIHIKDNQKGWLISGASIAGLSGAVVMSIQTNRLEGLYLNETDSGQIENRYQAYNQAYHWRNALFAAYVLIWTYAQIDLSYQLSAGSIPNVSIGRISNTLSMQYSISF